MAENVYDIIKDPNNYFTSIKDLYASKVLKIIYPDADDDDLNSNLYNVIEFPDEDTKNKILQIIIDFAIEFLKAATYKEFIPALFVFYIFNNFPDLKADILIKLKEEKLYDDINKLESEYSNTEEIWKNTELKDKEEKEEKESKKEKEEEKKREANQKILKKLNDLQKWPQNKMNAHMENIEKSDLFFFDNGVKKIRMWFFYIFQKHFANIQRCFYKDKLYKYCINEKLYENVVELYENIMSKYNIEKANVQSDEPMQNEDTSNITASNEQILVAERTRMLREMNVDEKVKLLRNIVQCEIAVIKKLNALYGIRKYRIFIKQLKELNDDDAAAAIELVDKNKEIAGFIGYRITTFKDCAIDCANKSELFQKIFADEIQMFKEKDDETNAYINKDFLINILTKEIEFSKDLNGITEHEISYYLQGGSRKNTKRRKNLSKTTKRRKNVRKTNKRRKNIRKTNKRRKNIRKTNKRIYTKRKSTTRRRK
jgi:hypothetical protein